VEARQDEQLLTTSMVSFHVQEPAAIRHQVPIRRHYPHPDTLKSWTEVLDDALSDKPTALDPFHKKVIKNKIEITPPIFYKLFDVSSYLYFTVNFVFQLRPIDPLRWSLRTRYPKQYSPTHHVYLKANGSPG
jgi:acyl-CoA thioesterase